MAIRFAYARHLSNSFPVSEEDRHSLVQTGGIQMRDHQATTLAATWNPLQAIAAFWNGTDVRANREANHFIEEAPRLPRHIRYDIGAIDCRPQQPRSRGGASKPQQNTLEAMWLRYF
jgi:hypothetical protein